MTDTPKKHTSVTILRSTLELLRRICRVHRRSPQQQISLWVELEAQELGLQDAVSDQPVFDGPATGYLMPAEAFVDDGQFRRAYTSYKIVEGPMHEGKCPRCGDDLLVCLVSGDRTCRRPGCEYVYRERS